MRRSTLTLVGFAIFVAAEVTFGLAPAYAVALGGLFGIGMAQVFAMVSCQTAVQVNVDEHYRGRVLVDLRDVLLRGHADRRAGRRHRRRVDRAPGDDRRSAVLLGGHDRRRRLLRYPGFRVLDESRLGFDDTSNRPARPRCTAPISTPPPT